MPTYLFLLIEALIWSCVPSRFQASYGDLLESEDRSAATRFFLDELDGPNDFSDRDQQFARVVPAMGKLVSAEVMQMTLSLTRLQAFVALKDSAAFLSAVSVRERAEASRLFSACGPAAGA